MWIFSLEVTVSFVAVEIFQNLLCAQLRWHAAFKASGKCPDTHMPKTLGGTQVVEYARGLPAPLLFVKVTFTSWANLPAHQAVKKAHLSFLNNS